MDTLSAGTGLLSVHASLQRIGADVLIALWGGTCPHIGSLAIAVPHPDRAPDAERCSTVLQFSFPGHRDEAVARRVAERVASALQGSVLVSAGIHVPGITPDEIEAVLANTDALIEKIIAALRETDV